MLSGLRAMSADCASRRASLWLMCTLAVAGSLALSASASFGAGGHHAQVSRARARCVPRKSRTIARSGTSVLLLRTTGPSDGKYGAPHSLLGCRKVAQRPVDLFDFEDGDTPMEVLTSFNGLYAAYYLGWAYTSCSFYISAGAEDCGTSLFESVNLLNGHTRVSLPSVREGGPPLPSALVVTHGGWIAWVSGTSAAGTPLLARDSKGQRTLDPGPIDAGSLHVSGADVAGGTWESPTRPHSDELSRGPSIERLDGRALTPRSALDSIEVPDEPSQLCVAHLDADAFYVSVELLRHPELRGKPVVVSGSGPRAVVTTASYEARRFGVGSAMPAARARRLCPDAVFLPPDFPAYREASGKIMGLMREHVERVEVVGLDEAYLDLAGLFSPRAAMRRLIAEIRAATGLTCSVGIGPNKLVAKVASDAEKPAGFVALSREQACARFGASPPSLVPGIGPKTALRLEELGLRTLAQLASAPEDVLIGRFGPNLGRDLGRRARFEHDGHVGEARKVVSESRERTFDRDISDPEELREALARMAGELCASLARHDRRGRTIAIKVRLADFTTVTRARTVETPTRDAELVTREALRLLEDYAPTRPVRLLGVRVAGLSAAQEGERAGVPDAEGSADRAGQLELPV
ncbi:MAG TPA: DNA polymerase IV [Solirubrobacteraceae bacterium]